jgi:hypothetical protein
MSDDDRERRKRGPFVGCLATALLAALPIYVLSIGPFVWLVDRGYMPGEFGVIYAPLGLLANNYEPAGSFLRWYVPMWQ